MMKVDCSQLSDATVSYLPVYVCQQQVRLYTASPGLRVEAKPAEPGQSVRRALHGWLSKISYRSALLSKAAPAACLWVQAAMHRVHVACPGRFTHQCGYPCKLSSHGCSLPALPRLMAASHRRKLVEVAAQHELDPTKRLLRTPGGPGNGFQLVKQLSVQHGHLRDSRAGPSRVKCLDPCVKGWQ